MVAFSTEFNHFTVEFPGDSSYASINEVQPLWAEYMSAKLSTEHQVHGQVVDTETCTVKLKIPETLAHCLDSMLPPVELCIKRMLGDRSLSSSKYYPELPCVISKSLIAKYQRNQKLKAVTNVVLPICGDKGGKSSGTPPRFVSRQYSRAKPFRSPPTGRPCATTRAA